MQLFLQMIGQQFFQIDNFSILQETGAGRIPTLTFVVPGKNECRGYWNELSMFN